MNKQIKLNFERKDIVKKFQRILCTGVMLGLMACSANAGAAGSSDVTIVDTKLDKVITVQQMVDSFTPYDVIFFGEFHDQDVLHSVEYDVLKKLYKKYGSRLVLSMEMFEKDNQEKLNNYLAGKITEDEFIKTSRPWPRYLTDYKPMIEFAKAHKIPVIASNIPRFLASTLAKQGTVENIEPRYRQYLPDKTYAPEGDYKEKFAGYMTRGGEVMKISQEKLNQVFAAQCIKDDKMAESILGESAAEPAAPAIGSGELSDIGDMLSGSELQAIISIISQLKSSSDDSRVQLINALKPHLSEERQKRADTAMKILKLLDLLPLIKESGLLKL